MAESLGPINTGYTPARPTDDLAQLGAGLQTAQTGNLLNQMQARTQESMMSAANVADQMANRQIQTRSDVAYKNNLVSMNISRDQREWDKLPYELRGMEASNWVNETVARKNELGNHLVEATMAQNIEQEALKTELDYANLQDIRLQTETTRRKLETVEKHQPAFNDYWDRADRGEIDPEESPRPDYGGSEEINNRHNERLKLWRGNRNEQADRLRLEGDIKAEQKQLDRMTGNQRHAVESETDPALRREKIYQAKRTNDALDLLKPFPTGAKVKEYMRDGLDPATGLALPKGKEHFDKDGNLTNHGISALNKSIVDLRQLKARADLISKTAVTDAAAMHRIREHAQSRIWEDQDNKDDFVSYWMKDTMDRNAELREMDETIPIVPPATAMAKAEQLWYARKVSTPMAAGGAAAGGAAAATGGAAAIPVASHDPLAELAESQKPDARLSISVLKRLGKYVTDSAKRGDAGMTADWNSTTLDKKAWFGGHDIDIEGAGLGAWPDIKKFGQTFNPMVEESSYHTDDDFDSISEAVGIYVQKLRAAEIPEDKILLAAQPHPAHLKMYGLRPPIARGKTWAYIEDGNDMNWFSFKTTSDPVAAAKKAAGKRGSGAKIWVAGVHFNPNGNPTGKKP